ncbi:MAG TPA: AraC family transcriptional regulator, partial [Lachnospiraceae bacterium]|nr:AraC family transcriptional regulator [Lachnospiraceae bacterium]
NVIYSEYNVRVRIICGSVVTGIRSFMSSYDEAMKYLKESIGSYKMMMKPEINMLRDELFQSIFLELKNEILANVGNYPRIMHVFDVFVQDTVSYKLSVSEVREHCFELASALYYAYIAASGEMADNRLSQLITALSMTNAAEACKATSKFITEILVHEEEINHEIIHKAKAYINQHLADDISVTVLAEQNFMSVSYFSRLFKKVVGIGCNEYIVQKRIKAAENLLLTTPLPTGEIALRVGYKNKNYFSLAFKRKTGMAPTELRETSHYSHECQASDDDL